MPVFLAAPYPGTLFRSKKFLSPVTNAPFKLIDEIEKYKDNYYKNIRSSRHIDHAAAGMQEKEVTK